MNVREWKRRGLLPSTAEFGGFRILGRSMSTSRLMVKEHVISIERGTPAPFYGPGVFMVGYYYDPYELVLEVGETGYLAGVVVWMDSSET